MKINNQEDQDDDSVQSRFRSVDLATIPKRSSKKNPMFKHTALDLIKEFMVDYWKDSTPNLRVSIQFQIETGINAHEKYDIRVSTDGMSLVVKKKHPFS